MVRFVETVSCESREVLLASVVMVGVLGAAPRTDGFYVPARFVPLADAPAVTGVELGFIEYLEFTRTEVREHLFLETDRHPWRWRKGVLEVKRADGWEAVEWLDRGAEVETDLFPGGVLHFVKGSLDARKKSATTRFEREQWTRLAGTWGEGADTLTVEKTGHVVRHGARRPAKLEACAPDCDLLPVVCLESGETLWLERGDALLEFPVATGGLCTSYWMGVPTAGGVVRARKQPGSPKGALTEAALQAALEARRPLLAECWRETKPLDTRLSLTVVRSGLVERVELGGDLPELLTACVTVTLGRLAFAPQAEARAFSVDWHFEPDLRACNGAAGGGACGDDPSPRGDGGVVGGELPR